MIVEETADQLKVVVDPLAKDKPTILQKNEIEARTKSELSLMPQGLLNRLSREEILDLVAFVLAGGDKKNKMFEDAHEHHHH
jgi:hypothetical protein